MNYTVFTLQTWIKIVYLANRLSLDYIPLVSIIATTVLEFHKPARKLHSYISVLEINLMWFLAINALIKLIIA